MFGVGRNYNQIITITIQWPIKHISSHPLWPQDCINHLQKPSSSKKWEFRLILLRRRILYSEFLSQSIEYFEQGVVSFWILSREQKLFFGQKLHISRQKKWCLGWNLLWTLDIQIQNYFRDITLSGIMPQVKNVSLKAV